MKRSFKFVTGKKNKPAALGIALQGGGAYGAFTKGVLKALLESDVIQKKIAEIKAVSGTSAGAVNGALLVEGLNKGGPEQAIENLDGLWRDVGVLGQSVKSLTAGFNFLSGTRWPNISHQALAMGRAALPEGYALEQLKTTVQKHVTDWEALQSGPAKLFVNAVREDPETGERHHKVFSGEELNADSITASGALEELGAQVIDGAKHYDGAYWANPSTDELEAEDISDLLIVTIQEMPNGRIRPEHQDDAREKLSNPGRDVLTSEIHNHIAHLHEERPDLNLHVINFDVPEGWDETSRMNTDPGFLGKLEKKGCEAGMEWLQNHSEKLGKQSSYSFTRPQPQRRPQARRRANG